MLIKYLGFCIGLIGVAAVSFGTYLIFEPLGFIVSGLFALFFSYLSSKNQSMGEGQ